MIRNLENSLLRLGKSKTTHEVVFDTLCRRLSCVSSGFILLTAIVRLNFAQIIRDDALDARPSFSGPPSSNSAARGNLCDGGAFASLHRCNTPFRKIAHRDFHSIVCVWAGCEGLSPTPPVAALPTLRTRARRPCGRSDTFTCDSKYGSRYCGLARGRGTIAPARCSSSNSKGRGRYQERSASSSRVYPLEKLKSV